MGVGGRQRLRVSKASLEGREVEVTAEHEALEQTLGNASDGAAVDGGAALPEGEVMIVGCGYPSKGEGVVLKIVDPVTLVLLTENQV